MKKVSSAQYQLFRQAVTCSKGSFQIVPARSKRPTRASLLDLDEDQKTDWVSWTDQPSLLDTMGLMEWIAQGLNEEEPVEKTTFSEALNTDSSTFRHLTVKQVFPREPYRLKVHKDAQYQPKPPTGDRFDDWKSPWSYQLSHKMTMDTEAHARRFAIYASLVDSMVVFAFVISELSPRDERSKLLMKKLTLIQEAQVAAMSSGFAAASNLHLLLRDALLQNFGFQYQVLSILRTAPFEGLHVLGPDPRVLQQRVRNIWQADRMTGSSVTFQKTTKDSASTQASKKTTTDKTQQTRTSVFDHLGSSNQPSTIQKTITQDTQSSHAGSSRGGRNRPNVSQHRKTSGATHAQTASRC